MYGNRHAGRRRVPGPRHLRLGELPYTCGEGRGLGIDEAELPEDAMDYLSLVVFLHSEMDSANLPFRDFSEMAHAASQGLSLAQGLCDDDRERLVRARIEPELHRLWPRDPDRVESEVQRLIKG